MNLRKNWALQSMFSYVSASFCRRWMYARCSDSVSFQSTSVTLVSLFYGSTAQLKLMRLAREPIAAGAFFYLTTVKLKHFL